MMNRWMEWSALSMEFVMLRGCGTFFVGIELEVY